jgi:hypothetical protein
VQDEGQIEDFLGIRIQQREDGTIEMSQPHLIQQILEDLHLQQPVQGSKATRYTPKAADIPANRMVILQRDPDGEDHKEAWSHIGKSSASSTTWRSLRVRT